MLGVVAVAKIAITPNSQKKASCCYFPVFVCRFDWMRIVDMVHAVPPGTHVLLDNVVFRPVRSQQFCTAGGGRFVKVCIKRV